MMGDQDVFGVGVTEFTVGEGGGTKDDAGVLQPRLLEGNGMERLSTEMKSGLRVQL